MKRLLSICITSYNRPIELRRCLESIKTSKPNKIEIIISEDLSPQREEIRQQIYEFKQNSLISVIENYNVENLGYDRNLEMLKMLATGEFILYMSDDDAIFDNTSLDEVIAVLEKHGDRISCMYTAYHSQDRCSTNRHYDRNFIIKPGKKSVIKFLYDSILFSGLIFKKSIVSDISAERFVNLNYFQVYMFMKVIYEHGGYYKAMELIDCIGDGENGYGTTELSEKNPFLANRSSIFSDITFNRGLIKVIKIFDEDLQENIIDVFSKEYSLRTYRQMSFARREGKDKLKHYWRILHDLGIKIYFPAPVYYMTLMFFGSDFCDKLYDLPRKILFKIRSR